MFAQILVSALAFNGPAMRAPTASRAAVNMGFEKELGVQPPLGFLDPIGLLKDADQTRFDSLRFIEIKHGRVAMLAVLGHIVTSAGVRLPGDLATGLPFSSVPAGLAALDVVPTSGLLQIIAFCGFLEFAVMKSVPGTGNEFVGDFRNGYLDFGWDKFTPDQKMAKRAVELNNGRAAQMGILGLMVHEKLDGNPYILNAMFGSPVPFNQ